MIRRPPRSTRTDTLFPDTKLFRSEGEPGELCVKGPQVMQGYWQKPDETEKVFTKDGWLKTGDVAVLEASGYLKIVDRKKDMILVRSEKHTSELQSLMRISYADFCLKKKTIQLIKNKTTPQKI